MIPRLQNIDIDSNSAHMFMNCQGKFNDRGHDDGGYDKLSEAETRKGGSHRRLCITIINSQLVGTRMGIPKQKCN